MEKLEKTKINYDEEINELKKELQINYENINNKKRNIMN